MLAAVWEVKFIGPKKNEVITKRCSTKQKARRLLKKYGGELKRISRA